MLCAKIERGHSFFAERETQDFEAAGSIIFLYDWTDENRRKNEKNIFTPSNLQKICEIEHIIIGDSEYSDYCQVRNTLKKKINRLNLRSLQIR